MVEARLERLSAHVRSMDDFLTSFATCSMLGERVERSSDELEGRLVDDRSQLSNPRSSRVRKT